MLVNVGFMLYLCDEPKRKTMETKDIDLTPELTQQAEIERFKEKARLSFKEMHEQASEEMMEMYIERYVQHQLSSNQPLVCLKRRDRL